MCMRVAIVAETHPATLALQLTTAPRVCSVAWLA